MLRVSNLKLGIDEDISLLKKLILKKLKIINGININQEDSWIFFKIFEDIFGFV